MEKDKDAEIKKLKKELESLRRFQRMITKLDPVWKEWNNEDDRRWDNV